jgi:hypothetical protein
MVKQWFGILLVCLFLSMTVGIWVHLYLHPEVHFSWEASPIFYAVYGFIGCIVIILGSKAIGHLWLQKKENYYQENEKNQGEN